MAEVMQKKQKKAPRTAPPSQVCSVCGAKNVVTVAGVRPRTCVECVVWPPDPKTKKS